MSTPTMPTSSRLRFLRSLGVMAALLVSLVAFAPMAAAAEPGPGNEDDETIDYCDWNTNKRSGGVAKWLNDNEVDTAECFDWDIADECGLVTVTLTEFPLVGENPYRAVWIEGSEGGAYKNFPATFAEDYNGGSVTISWFVVGPEKDYLKGRGTNVPNFWDETFETIEINTNCQTPPPPPPPVVTPTTAPGTTTTEVVETVEPTTTTILAEVGGITEEGTQSGANEASIGSGAGQLPRTGAGTGGLLLASGLLTGLGATLRFAGRRGD